MKRINVLVEPKVMEFIDGLVNLEIFPSRNEAVRSALKDFVQKESQFLSNLNNDVDKLKTMHRKYVEFREKAREQIINQLINNTESSISIPENAFSKNG